MSAITANPPSVEMALTENLSLSLDVSALLADGETVTETVCTLVDQSTGRPVAGFVSAPSVAGSTISQVVSGELLLLRTTFILTWTFTGSASGNTWSSALRIIPVDH